MMPREAPLLRDQIRTLLDTTPAGCGAWAPQRTHAFLNDCHAARRLASRPGTPTARLAAALHQLQRHYQS